MYFRYFVIVFPWKRVWPFIWSNLNPLHPRTPQWFLTGRFLNFVNVFSLFRNYLPLEKGVAIHLYKLEFPSTKDVLCQVWLKLAQWFWRTTLPWKKACPFICKTLIFAVRWERTEGSVCRKVGKKMTQEDGEGYMINQMILENMKMWKVYRQSNRRTDGQTDWRSDNSLLELSARAS